MTASSLSRKAVVGALAALLVACRYASIPEETLASRALDVPAATGPGHVTATYFPVTHANAVRRAPVVVVEPRVFTREALHRGARGGLLAYLNFKGHPAWRLTVDTPNEPSRAIGTALATTIRAISQASGEPALDVVGASLNAPSALHAVSTLAEEGSSPVRRVVFLGAGLDYAYPSSFVVREHEKLGGPTRRLCATEAACLRFVHHPDEARPFFGSLPPAEPDDTSPAHLRYPGLAQRTERVLFVVGKADGLAPSESSFPVFLEWGKATPEHAVRSKRFFLAARENGLGDDYDHAALFLGADAESEVFAAIVDFLEQD